MVFSSKSTFTDCSGLGTGNDVIKKGKAFQNHFFSSLFSDIDEKHQKIFKETLELMKKNIDCLLEEK